MLGWSLKLFRVRGILLAVHFSFFLLLGYLAWEGWKGDPENNVAGGWEGALTMLALYLAFFGCVVLHEFGHSFTAMHFGVGVRRILLMPIGGMAEFDGIPREPGRELLITLAGPAVNFVIAGVLWLWVGLPANWSLVPFGGDFDDSITGFFQLLLHMNLYMGLFNLAPVFPMDGGRILRALLATRLPYLRATFVAATVAKVLAVVGVVLAVMWELPLLAALFTFIFVAGEIELRATRRREIEDAHWRETLARYYAATRPLEEPPVV